MTEDVYIGHVNPCAVNSIGPGRRFGIWVRGCTLACPDCITPQYITPGKHTVSTDSILSDIKQSIVDNNIEGITFSGGEPFQQPLAIYEIAKECRNIGLSIISWSGYTLEELSKSNDTLSILNLLDVLIDGRYKRNLKFNDSMRGSSNQNIHLLTSRYSISDLEKCKPEYRINDDSLTITGVSSNYDAIVAGLNILGIEL